MKKQSIIIGFTHYKDGPLAAKATEIITRMSGNAHFPNPDPSLQAVQAKLDVYGAALAALDRTRHNTLLKRQARKALEAILHLLGLFVIQHGNDDPVILESSGFDLASVSLRRAAKGGFTVKNGDPTGTMHLSCGKVKGARIYLYQYALKAAPDVWYSEFSTRNEHLLEGLQPHQEYCFRMAAITGKEHKPSFTEVVSKHVN